MKKQYINFNHGAGGAGGGGGTEKTPAEIIAEIKGKMEAFDTAVKNMAPLSEIQAIKAEIDTLRQKANDERMDAMQKKYDEIVQAQGEEITKLKDAGGITNIKGHHASLSDMIVKGIADNKDAILKAVENGGKLGFEIKAAGTMTITGNYSGGTVGLSTLEPGITRVQRRRPFLRQIVNAGGTTSKFVVWIEQANPDPGVAGTVAEGAAKPQTDFDLVERSAEVRKIAVWIKVSKEMLADVPFIEAEIRNELMELVELKLDEQILSGDNIAPNFKGLEEYTVAFDAATFASTIPDANRFDVLRVAIAQIEAANFLPNYIILNPQDVAKMELTKDAEGRYLMPPFLSADGMMLHGVRIIANNGVDVGDFIVGDFTKANLRVREDMNIQVGYVNDDFTKNLITILAEMRAVFYVKTNHIPAFVQGDFTTAIAALNLAIV